MEDKNLVTMAEASKTLGISERTVRRWVSSGKLKKFREGGQILIELPNDNPVIIQQVTAHEIKRTDTDSKFMSQDVHVQNELTQMVNAAMKRTVRWQVVSLVSLAAMSILVVMMAMGWGLYKGMGGQLGVMKTSLSAVSSTLAREEARADRAEANLSQAQKEARTLVSEKERLQKERDQAIQDLADQINRREPEKPASWLNNFLESGKK